MASPPFPFITSTASIFQSSHRAGAALPPRFGCRRFHKTRCCVNNSTEKSPPPENLLIRIAWYVSESLGVAASLFRSSEVIGGSGDGVELRVDESGRIDRAAVVQAVKEDFERAYFVTGNLTDAAYEEDCEFADPAGSFRGLKRFKRNCTNFGYLLDRSDMKLTKWEDFEDRGIGHWRFISVMSFPWKPILSATGYTEYYLDEESGKICRHVEHWNVPKMALLKQILRPNIGLQVKNSSKES